MRPQNEDSLGWGRIGAPLGDELGLVFVVADGLGAYGGGDVASRLAVETALRLCADASGPGLQAGRLLRSSFDIANRAIFDAALEGAGARRMQTTMSALLLRPGEAHLGHVGDCRTYRLRDDDLTLLTTDHTQVMEMLRMRLITPEQAADHPARYALTRSLGAELLLRTDVRKESLEAGDCFLVCSDGLWGKLDAAEIRSALGAELDSACEGLVAKAVERGGEDNATVMAVRVIESGEAPARPQGWRRFFLS